MTLLQIASTAPRRQWYIVAAWIACLAAHGSPVSGQNRLESAANPWPSPITPAATISVASRDKPQGDSVVQRERRTRQSCRCPSDGTLMLWTNNRWCGGGTNRGGPDLDAPLVTDRPDFTEASSTVGRGVVQLEIGYTYRSDDDGTTSTNSNSLPETLLRYGVIADWLELRVGWNYADEESGGNASSGSEDLYLGFKIGLTPQAGPLPEMALIPQLTVPTGASSFTSDEALPGINWIYGWQLNDCISTAGSTQFNRSIEVQSADAYTEWAQSWTVAMALCDTVGAYTEYFGHYPTNANTAEPEHYFNGGFSYLISNDIQWDIRAGAGLNDAAADYFAGTGFSIRFK